MSDYAKSAPEPFELIVRDKDSITHAFPATAVNEQSIQDHLKLAYFGAPGDRRPLIS
jgi:Ni,Fe-hydrogenase III component G